MISLLREQSHLLNVNVERFAYSTFSHRASLLRGTAIVTRLLRCTTILTSEADDRSGGPIGRWVSDTPEFRRGFCEFHGNPSWPRQLFFYGYDAALFLLPTCSILHDELLFRRYFFHQGRQCPMSIDNQGLCHFGEWRAFRWASMKDDRNAQRDPLTPALLRPFAFLRLFEPLQKHKQRFRTFFVEHQAHAILCVMHYTGGCLKVILVSSNPNGDSRASGEPGSSNQAASPRADGNRLCRYLHARIIGYGGGSRKRIPGVKALLNWRSPWR